MVRSVTPYWVGLLATAVIHSGACGGESPPDFSREIRPVLSEYCFTCHGPDAEARQAELRLDVASEARADRGGYRVIVPGRSAESELVRRMESTDPDTVMPPPGATRRPTAADIALLKRWIDSGAGYESHWAWTPVEETDIPDVNGLPASHQAWSRNPIDHFVLQKMQRAGLVPSREADRTTLIRRVTLDLTGLPPTPEEVDAFVADSSPDAWARVVDRLLASPHYGERMAVDWLDAARYADTNGYQADRDREMSAWRDWVIAAFSENKPFDEFTIEQLAGDLLPNPTVPQQIATGFHRNHILNEEGGIIPEEFLAEYCADRVETTATVWLGQTFTCARCHDHKFDPWTQIDYYGLYAFFHNIAETGAGNFFTSTRRSSPPWLQLPTPEQAARKAEAAGNLKALESQLASVAGSDPEHAELKKKVDAARKEFDEADLAIATTLVMKERETPRETFVLIRGAYDRPGERVTAATPAILPPMADGLPRNRLGLAQWLVNRDNPLTARVTVNRIWQSLMGTGIVSSSEDFGSQGQYPTHPRLLDWLAVEFMDSGWDLKATIRLIVMSATYRQDARRRPETDRMDPENWLLARGPRFRLPAETIRDQALMASGLLDRTIGGPSVKPYHPAGLYEQVAAGGVAKYEPDSGASLYRRSLYTYWKRSVPHPAMLAFDVPFRETCTVRRSRTNTPMQALNLMNDPTYVEAARFLAARAIHEGGSSPASRIRHGFRLVMARSPTPHELTVLQSAFQRSLSAFRADPAAADEFLAVGSSGVACECEPPELAAWTVVMNTILNMDETVTRE